MTTRLSSSSASTRAASRSIVVLPMPGRPMIRIALARLDQVADDLDRAEDGAADAAGQADDLAAAVADGRDAVQRALDAGAVVVAERADVIDDVLDVLLGDLALEQHLLRRQRRSAPPAGGRGPSRPRSRHAFGQQRGMRWISGGSASSRASIPSVSSSAEPRRFRPSLWLELFVSFVRLTNHECLPGQRTAGTSAGSATRTVSFISNDTCAIG